MADSTTRQEIELLQGFISDTINASSDASLESGIDAEVSASAASSDGDSTAKSLLQTAEGIKSANLEIDGNATVGVQNLLRVIADATGVSGDAESETSIGSTTGLKADDISVEGTASVVGNVSTQLQSESDTTGGDSSSSTNLAESIGVDVTAIDAKGEFDLSSAATTTLNAKAEVTNSTADTETIEGAKASNTLTTARGTRLTSIDAGDDTNISASVGISTGAEANAATGDSEAINNASDIAALELTSSEPTETARVQNFDADGIISAESDFSSTADASTTSGTASAVDNFGVVDAVQLGDSTINVDGDSTISGSVNLSSRTNAVNVSGGDVSAGSAVESSSGINQDNTPEKGTELSIQGDASLTGAVNSNKTVTAESTEGNATATTGAIGVGANQFGIDLQSLIVEGNTNLTGQVSNNETTTTESTKGDTTSIAFGTDRIGLQAYSLETKGEATIKATNSSSNEVSADTTQGDAFAVLGNDVAAMRNIAMDNSVIKSGNDTTITAATFGESQATAESVKESASAGTISEAIGVYQSAFESGGEFDITSTAVNAGNVTASTVGDGIETLDQASAFANLKAQAINLENWGSNDLGLETAGNANVTASGGIQTDVTSTNTDGDAIADADLEALGMQIQDGSIGGDANIQTIGLIDISNISAETTSSGEAAATAEIAVNSLEVTDGLIVGGKADFTSQTTAKLNIESDNIKGDATSSSNQEMGEGYSVAGMQLNGLDLASDSTFASILVNEFNTSAKTVEGDSAANTNQALLGIGFQGAENMASGDVSISSVMSHTSFTEASSVQGIATVEDKLSAVGIEIDTFDVDGDASFSSNVVVRASSSTES